jgi:4-hydroxy-3-polyprenylbenzoate decarboxylase
VTKRVVVALTGASGAIYGIRTLEVLQGLPDIETHLILSAGARATIALETDATVAEVAALADVVHQPTNLAAPISSGSFRAHGMIVAPCSVKTLSSVANCHGDNLIARAADVMLKERRPLILLFRETPLHTGQIRLMLLASEAGAIVMPPVPAFYHRPSTIDDIVDQTVGRALDQLDIEADIVQRWEGPDKTRERA